MWRSSAPATTGDSSRLRQCVATAFHCGSWALSTIRLRRPHVLHTARVRHDTEGVSSRRRARSRHRRTDPAGPEQAFSQVAAAAILPMSAAQAVRALRFRHCARRRHRLLVWITHRRLGSDGKVAPGWDRRSSPAVMGIRRRSHRLPCTSASRRRATSSRYSPSRVARRRRWCETPVRSCAPSSARAAGRLS